VLKGVLKRREDERFPRIFFGVELIQAFREDPRRQKKSSLTGEQLFKEPVKPAEAAAESWLVRTSSV
jgi:hypothetical protein